MKQEVCRRKYPSARYVLGDVAAAEDSLKVAMAGHDLVVHAAAMKYIPEAEVNASECIRVNLNGAQAVVRAARWAGIKRVVGISTDKAVQPVNIYGATKMAQERLFGESSCGGTVFTCARYGNVVGSTGSVVPLFQQQHQESGRVRITDPNMTRFWMSIEEAIDLILIALTEASPGSVIVPMARAMKISDVAKAAISDDVEMEVIGQRPGEKLHEQLIHWEESVRVRKHQSWFELLPPGETKIGQDAFTLASHTPNLWMTRHEMRELIADAETV